MKFTIVSAIALLAGFVAAAPPAGVLATFDDLKANKVITDYKNVTFSSFFVYENPLGPGGGGIIPSSGLHIASLDGPGTIGTLKPIAPNKYIRLVSFTYACTVPPAGGTNLKPVDCNIDYRERHCKGGPTVNTDFLFYNALKNTVRDGSGGPAQANMQFVNINKKYGGPNLCKSHSFRAEKNANGVQPIVYLDDITFRYE